MARPGVYDRPRSCHNAQNSPNTNEFVASKKVRAGTLGSQPPLYWQEQWHLVPFADLCKTVKGVFCQITIMAKR
ncbi:hypothetical protein V8C43DRAFT_266556 [Trichoderma afarasin]